VGILQLLTTLFSSSSQNFDWNLCCFCQRDISENLQCPNHAKNPQDIGAGYKTLSDTLMTFKSNNYSELPFFVTDNTDSSQLFDILKNNVACWQKFLSI
jgi:hypothetical protein